MKLRIAYERSVNVLVSSLAMVAQRLPFLKNLTPIFGGAAGVNFAAPLTVTFVGTHSLSGQSVMIVPVNGGTTTATVTAGDQFVWSFKASPHTLAAASGEIDGVEELPEGLAFFGPQSGVMSLGGVPTEPGEYAIVLKGYRRVDRIAGTTDPYLFTLTVAPGEDPPTPYEEFVATFWSGENLNDPLLVNATADPDADGIQNVMEFVLDLDPTKPDVMPGAFGIDPEDPQKMRYEVPLNIAAGAVAVGFEEGLNLETGWAEVLSENVTRTETSIVLSVPLAGEKFYRLKVVME
ncbi:MAG: hypothetical protein ACJAT6_000225 [Akkermansiaceae bacterium]|jgi:hypothetical protein|tara:strand:+ start:1091 stop:1966 length:876 start_codon:yes stop_codon:yes gene_type:complete